MIRSKLNCVGVGVAYPFDTLKTKCQTFSSSSSTSSSSTPSSFEIVRSVLKTEGIGGFYGGVSGVMLGQSIIKAVAFSSNAWALDALTSPSSPFHSSSSSSSTSALVSLTLAAAISGFITSFFVNPIERIKILMQANVQGTFSSELDCLFQILRADGAGGLVLRGLAATMGREIPGYGLYFVVYSLLRSSEVSRKSLKNNLKSF